MSAIGLVLAAGASRRFGSGCKLCAELAGRPVAAHAAAAMAATPLAGRLAVVSGDAVAAHFAGFGLVRVAPGQPQSASLAAGLAQARRLGATRLLVSLADTPLVTPDLLSQVDALALRMGAAAASDGTRRSPPAAFVATHFPALAALSGDRGAGAILRALPAEALVAAPGLLADIDTPQDLDRLGERMAAPNG